MSAIWKFPLEPGVTTVVMPVGAEILHVATQDEVPCIWALVDPDAKRDRRSFVTIGTGHPADDVTAEQHVGTVFLANGALVFHVFEVTP